MLAFPMLPHFPARLPCWRAGPTSPAGNTGLGLGRCIPRPPMGPLKGHRVQIWGSVTRENQKLRSRREYFCGCRSVRGGRLSPRISTMLSDGIVSGIPSVDWLPTAAWNLSNSPIAWHASYDGQGPILNGRSSEGADGCCAADQVVLCLPCTIPRRRACACESSDSKSDLWRMNDGLHFSFSFGRWPPWPAHSDCRAPLCTPECLFWGALSGINSARPSVSGVLISCM